MGSYQKFCLRWNNHSSNFVGNLGSLLASEEYSDVTVCCQGEVWHLHQLVLSASSAHFANLLHLIPPGQTPILILDGPPACDIEALIHFIYHGEVNVDQESLPSLLRTAASFKIKGLADVSTLTGELKREPQVSDELSVGGYDSGIPSTVEEIPVPVEISNNVMFDNITPLNLSRNKSSSEDEETKFEGKRKKLAKKCNEFSFSKEVKSRDTIYNSETTFNPSPSKKIRTLEPVGQNSTVAVIAPNGCSSSLLTPFVASQEKIHRHCNSSMTKDQNLSIKSCDCGKDIVNSPEIQYPLVEGSLPSDTSKENTSYVNISSNVSLPILKMALSPHIAYQPSSPPSVPSKVNEPSVPDRVSLNAVKDIQHVSSLTDLVQIPTFHKIPIQTDTVASSSSSVISTKSIKLNSSAVHLKHQKIGTKEDLSKEHKQGFVVNTFKNGLNSSQQVDTTTSENETITTTTFTHKKFSACTIPQSAPTVKTFHIVKGVNENAVKANQDISPSVITPFTDINSLNDSAEILGQTSSNITQLTPVIVTSCCLTSKQSPTHVNNSVIYSISNDCPSKETLVISTSDTMQLASISSPQNTDQTSQYLQSIFKPTLKTESSDSSQENSLLTISTNTSGESTGSSTNSQNSQRVTVNMRTFKEEWRRQLLVDYDPNTNMSICMLCFTTFKSYDGPRKNTYVKHAKRFHPSLEDYSQEERAAIISMYEKYHKYDIDMQKEINKSFRTTNNSSSALKRIRATEYSAQLFSSSLHHSPTSTSSSIGNNGSQSDSGSKNLSDQNVSIVIDSNESISDVTPINESKREMRSAENSYSLEPDEQQIINNNNNNDNKNNRNSINVTNNPIILKH